MSGIGRIDHAKLAQPEQIAWRLDEARRVINDVSKRVMHCIPREEPSAVVSILVAAACDVAAVTCVHDPLGYEAAAKLYADLFHQRLLQARLNAETQVRGAYVLQMPTHKGTAT